MLPSEAPDIEQLKAKKNKRGLVEALAYREDIHIRLAAALALEEVGWTPASQEEAALYAIAKGKFTWCLQVGAPAIGPLCGALPDPDERVRRQATLALGKLAEQLHDPQACTAIAQAVAPLLGDPAEGVSSAARSALEQCGPDGIEALCETAIEGENKTAKLAALQLLAESGPAGCARLMERIRSRSWLLQAGDLQILGESRDERWLDILLTFLQEHQNWPARAKAAEGLAELGKAQAVDALLKAYYEACAVYDQSVHDLRGTEFEQAYREMRRDVVAMPELNTEAELLLACYRPAPAGEKLGADAAAAQALMTASLQALVKLGGRRAANGLILALRIQAGKQSAPRALGALKEKRAIPGLRALLSDKDRAIRREAEAVLVLLGEDV